MDLHPDFKDLLADLVREKVEFAIIGGYAVGMHAKPRATKDLDVLVSGNEANLERAARALEHFGAPANVVQATRTMAKDEVVYLGREPVRIDIMRSADGIDTDAVIARAVKTRIDGVDVPVIALADLIANKKASGRPQDLADVAVLERVRHG
jgi:predicted nucleotidyltransferase